ncbi:hypothetical protein [Pseudoroseicyclus sp. CXY001]|uniref:hypothetical protein n=1 Tax=Pseudoroseicyclus sp. CXY001 TaxID=3242492 RepID=UPI00358DA9BE
MGNEAMEELQQYEARISEALGRIRVGMGALRRPAPGQGPADFERLEVALDEEKTANAQLGERVRALKARLEAAEAAKAEAEAKAGRAASAEGSEPADQADHREALGRLDAELRRLQEANAGLRDASAELRAAAEAGAVDPALIDQAMKAELEALTAARAAEIAEIDAILAEFRPLLGDEAGEGA